MKKPLLLIFLVQLFNFSIYSQDTTSLALNIKAPSLVLPSSKSTVESFSFPYQKKIVYLHFWSSSNAASKENFYKYKRLYKQNSEAIYKNCDGFEIILVALQDDRLQWENDITKYNLENLKNFIALKGFKDYFVSKYNLKTIPTSMIINPEGYIAAINPEITVLKNYIEENRNYVASYEKPKELAGKITHGQSNKTALGNEKVYVTNSISQDTIQTITTNNSGDFVIKNADKNSDITLKVGNSEKIKENEYLFLQNDDGDIISDFNHTPNGYEYKLQTEDFNDLKSSKVKYEQPKKLMLSENLFKSGGNSLTNVTEKKLDVLMEKLIENPKLNIQITTHTDCKGDSKYNNELSLKRANAIATYFVRKGIDKSRIITIGKGESEPLNRCIDGEKCSEAELEINRRTEFVLFEKK